FAAVPNVYRDIRVRISWPITSSTVISCSTDSFAIRPNQLVLTATDSDWATAATATVMRTLNNAVADNGVVHKAGRVFTLRATAQGATGATTTNYSGAAAIPTVKAGSPTCTLPAVCVTGTLGLGTLTFASGVATSNTAHYDEVGVITLELEDSTFAGIDSSDG